jgi:hypothetical protein
VPVIAIPLAFQARRRVRRGSDKRPRSKPDMDIPYAPRLDFLLEKKIETEPPSVG